MSVVPNWKDPVAASNEEIPGIEQISGCPTDDTSVTQEKVCVQKVGSIVKGASVKSAEEAEPV